MARCLADNDISIICYDAIMKSDVKFGYINYRTGTVYIAMNLSKEEQEMSNLHRVLPWRTAKGGVRPGVSSNPEKEDKWEFPKIEYTELEKRRIVATIVQIGVLVMMNTHLYTFDGKIYLQQEGGPIGLRSTCAIARIVMNEFDARWLEEIESNNIKIRKGQRYMDDLRNPEGI